MPLISIGNQTPAALRSGDTVRWDLTFPSYPASAHSLEYLLVSRSQDVATTWRAAPSGDTFELRLSSADTMAMIAGTWAWDIVVTETATGDRLRVDGGNLLVRPKPGARKEKTFNEDMVEILESYLAGNLKHGHESTTIRGQSISRMTFADANGLLNEFRSKVAVAKMNDRVARGQSSGMTGRVSFRL